MLLAELAEGGLSEPREAAEAAEETPGELEDVLARGADAEDDGEELCGAEGGGASGA